MSTLDLAAIRQRAATWFRPGTQHPVERDVLDLLDEVDRLRHLYADHRAVIEAQAAEVDRLRAALDSLREVGRVWLYGDGVTDGSVAEHRMAGVVKALVDASTGDGTQHGVSR